MASALPDGWLDELADVLAIPSVSADPAHAEDVARAAEWVAGKVRALGGEAELREDGRLVVGEIAGPPDAPTVLVYGHYDVQPPAPLELWESEPFGAEVRGEWLYARGIADDKGQLWMQLEAIEELISQGAPPVSFASSATARRRRVATRLSASSSRTTGRSTRASSSTAG